MVEGQGHLHPEDKGFQGLLDRRDVVGQRDVLVRLGVLADVLKVAGALLNTLQQPVKVQELLSKSKCWYSELFH